jgi:Mrp family chromosome partitioning ATPase
VVSAAPHDGRTSVAANLAVAAGEAGQQVVLCDADLSSPGLTRLLDLEGHTTLETALRNAIGLELNQLAGPARGVHALGAAGSPGGHAALLAENRLRAVVEQLPKTVDLVIVDTSPLLSSADVLELVQQADLVLFVVRERVSKKADITSALGLIRQVGGEVAGIVVTGSYTSSGTQRRMRRRATSGFPLSEPGDVELPDSTSATNVSNR